MEEVREKIAEIVRVIGHTSWNPLSFKEKERMDKNVYKFADQILSIEVTEGVSIKDLIEKGVIEK